MIDSVICTLPTKLSNASSSSPSDIFYNPSLILKYHFGLLVSDFFFWLFALDSTLIKIVYHKLHWSTRLRLRGFVWHVQGYRRHATQEGGDEDMLRQSAEADGSVI